MAIYGNGFGGGSSMVKMLMFFFRELLINPLQSGVGKYRLRLLLAQTHNNGDPKGGAYELVLCAYYKGDRSNYGIPLIQEWSLVEKVGRTSNNMNSYISELIKDYDGTNYEQFARYIYLTFQKEIDGTKGTEKNKYIKIRNDILKYIVTNRGKITLELRRNK